MSLIVALDPPKRCEAVRWTINMVHSIGPESEGIKVGVPLAVRIGIKGLRDVLSVSSHKLKIADMKLADIGYVMSLTAEAIAEAGVNGIIAHAFVGEEELKSLKRTCDELGMKLIILGLMSHPGASQVMLPEFLKLLSIIKNVAPWGTVLPATLPDSIVKGRELLGNQIKILSPGVGAQGASPGDALCAGADYEIVGRLITLSENPSRAVKDVIKKQRLRVESCRGL